LLLAAALAMVPLAAAAQALPDTLGRIRAAGQVNIGYSPDSLPFSVRDADGRPAGYSIELCQRIVTAIGREVGNPNLRVNWIAGTVAERLAAVKAGRADLECANTTATISRMADVDFSSLVFVDSGGFLVRADGPIQQFTEFAGKRIGVIAGTTTEQRLALALKERNVAATVVPVRDGPEGTAMLEAGTLDGFAGDKVKLVGLAVTARNPASLSLLAADLSYEPYAFALPRGDASLRLVVNRELTRIYVSGEVEGIFMRHLGRLGRPSGLLSAMYLLNAIPD
jgi:polar amino acid transport system substrate-binding protein/glutamate/aspartate transport system substrate-binding protein